MSARKRRIGLLAGLVALLSAISPPCFASPILNIGQNFIGSAFETNSQGLPPDANGAVGPQHFVELINGSFAVYAKSNGQAVLRLSDVDFWGGAGVTFTSDQAITDPRMIYDPLSQRWFASMVDLDANATDPTTEANDFLLAFSDTSDPTKNWTGFKFRADPTTGNFADFPTLGVDSNAVYLSGNMFSGGADNTGPNLVSIPKVDLLNSNISTRTYFGILSSNVYGLVLQAATCFDASTNGTILSMGDIGSDVNFHSNMFTFHVLGAGTSQATLSTPVQITVDPYMCPFNTDQGVPVFMANQSDGTQNLQANDPRLAAKVYNVGGVLYGVHNTEFNNRIAIQWYRIDAATGALLEQGMISDTDLDLFYPSIAANKNGVVVIGCNGSSIDTFISSFAYIGQTVAGTTTFGNRILLQSGRDDYQGEDLILGADADSRWGDYSATSVDPTDPTQFWTIQMIPTDIDTSLGDELGDPSYDFGVWSTWITQLQIVSSPQLTITPAGANVLISWPTFAANFQLQSNPNLASSNWTVITPTLTTNGNQISTLVPRSDPQNFFRLQQ